MTPITSFSPGQADEAATPGGDVSLSEVLAMITALANEVRAAHAERLPVPKERAGALIAAAHLLRDHDLDWPASLGPALTDLAEMFRVPAAQAAAPDVDTPATAVRDRMMRLMGAQRPREGTP